MMVAAGWTQRRRDELKLGQPRCHSTTCVNTWAAGSRKRRLLSDQRDLQIGGAVLLRIETTSVNIARAPKQQVTFEVDEVVLHEVRSFFQSEGREILSEYALRRVDRPRSVSSCRNLVEHIGKPL